MKATYGLIYAFLFLGILPFVSAKVVINEIMYSPLGDDDSLEWIELVNDGATTVDVSAYKIDSNAFDDAFIPAQGFLVIARQLLGNGSFSTEYGNKDGVWNASDSFAAVDGSFVLTNTGKTITLTDGSGIVVDAVNYSDALANNNGKTLERTNAVNSNFKESSALGGSPGAVNNAFNSAPVVTAVSPDKTSLLIGEDKGQSFSATITDPQNNAVSTWSVDGIQKMQGNSFLFNASSFSLGMHIILFTVTDGEFTISRSWNVIVSDVPVSSTMNVSYNASAGLNKATAVVFSTSVTKVDFGSQELDLRVIVDLDAGVTLTKNTVGIDTTLFPQLATTATITFSSHSLSTPLIVSHPSVTGIPITPCTACPILVKTNNALTFTVPSFSLYKAVEYSSIFSLSAPDTVSMDIKKGETVTKNVTVTNNGVQPLTNMFFSFVPESGYNATLSNGGTGNQPGPFILAPGESKTITISTLIAASQDVRKTLLGTLTITAKELSNKSIPVIIFFPTKLVFSDLLIKIDDEIKRHIVDGNTITKVHPGSVITLTVEIANTYQRVENKAINDIVIDAVLKGLEKDGDNVDEDERISSLQAEDEIKKKFSFVIPFDTEDKTYPLVIEANGVDEFNQVHKAKATFQIIVGKELHDLRIIKMDISHQGCSSPALLEVLFKNIGRHDEDDARVDIVSPELDFSFSKKISLYDGDNQKSEFLYSTSLDLPQNAVGIYPLTARIYRDHDRLEDEQIATIEVNECALSEEKQNIISEKKETIIVNEPFVKKIASLPQAPNKTFSPQTSYALYALIGSIFFVFALYLLAIVVKQDHY